MRFFSLWLALVSRIFPEPAIGLVDFSKQRIEIEPPAGAQWQLASGGRYLQLDGEPGISLSLSPTDGYLALLADGELREFICWGAKPGQITSRWRDDAVGASAWKGKCIAEPKQAIAIGLERLPRYRSYTKQQATYFRWLSTPIQQNSNHEKSRRTFFADELATRFAGESYTLFDRGGRRVVGTVAPGLYLLRHRRQTYVVWQPK